MTYLERITYLEGRFLEVFQYALYNAYRVATFSDGVKDLTPQSDTEENAQAKESQARAHLIESQGKGFDAIAEDLFGHGLSFKDEKELKSLLLKRNYLVSYFFVDCARELAKEDPKVYENKIDELQEYVDRAIALNGSLAKAFDKILDRDYRHRGM